MPKGAHLFGGVFVSACLAWQVIPAKAQPSNEFMECSEALQPLLRIPEIRSVDGILSGVMMLESTSLLLNVKQGGVGPSTPPGENDCRLQNLRNFRGLVTQHASYGEGEGNGTLPGPFDPMPGPTLRARVGDIIQLTLLNHINPTWFGGTFDKSSVFSGFSDAESQGETGDVRCDQSPSYPMVGGDTFPNCLHASNTANLHFHGTHTNPGTTGDNVLVEVSPSPRDDAEPAQPLVTAQSAEWQLKPFFDECLVQLGADNVEVWPKVWGDLPAAWTAEQEALLRRYDEEVLVDFNEQKAEGDIPDGRPPRSSCQQQLSARYGWASGRSIMSARTPTASRCPMGRMRSA